MSAHELAVASLSQMMKSKEADADDLDRYADKAAEAVETQRQRAKELRGEAEAYGRAIEDLRKYP